MIPSFSVFICDTERKLLNVCFLNVCFPSLLQAEQRLAARRAARAEARDIRMKELEKQQKEVSVGATQ